MLNFEFSQRDLAASLLLGSALCLTQPFASPAAAQYRLTSLAANEKDLGHDIPQAAHIHPRTANAWGLAYSAKSGMWITDELNGVATEYATDGASRHVVTVPRAPEDPLPPGSPTGIVANSYGGFTISENGKSGSAELLVVTLDGTISGWNPKVDSSNAVIAVDNFTQPAAYTGLGITHDQSGTFIYAANAFANRIEKYDSNFNLVTTFNDPNIPFPVYGVSALQGDIYVSFAPFFPGKPGAGAVDVFDTGGNLIKTLIPPGGALNIPYAMALAPANFGQFSNALLVGNLQDGHINAFDPTSGALLGALADEKGRPIAIPGIWDFDFGGGGTNNGKTNELYLVAGPDTYWGGLFAKIVAEN